MKKYLISLIALLYSIVAQALTIDVRTGQILSGEAQMPEMTITEVLNGYDVTYSISSVEITEIDTAKNIVKLYIPGFNTIGKIGYPELPYKNDAFVVETGYTPAISILKGDSIDLNYSILPAQIPVPESSNIPEIQNEPISMISYIGFYPANVVSREPDLEYRDHQILSLGISPAIFDANKKVLRIYSSLTYKIRFSSSEFAQQNKPGKIIHAVDKTDPFLSNFTINWNSDIESERVINTQSLELTPITPIEPEISSNQEAYLIITHTSLSKAADEFAEWKRKLGFDVKVVTSNSWSTQTVKSAVKSEWNSKANLKYLLILGSHSLVPTNVGSYSFSQYYSESYASDHPYACLGDDSDSLPDICYGRIPINTYSEFLIVFDKIYRHESTYIPSTYKKGTHIAYFESISNTTGTEERRFTLTAEEVRDKAIDNGFDIKRLYFAYSPVNPQKWYESRYSVGASESSGMVAYRELSDTIPNFLKKPFYSWAVSKDDINNAFNSGNSYILYRGHGSENCLSNLNYLDEYIESMQNKSSMPIVFSVACSTGNFTTPNRCFAEQLLLAADKGCTSIIAATRPSYTSPNDTFTLGLFKSLWYGCINSKIELSINHFPEQTNIIGQMMNQAFSQVRKQYGNNPGTGIFNELIYHCLGDPSLQVYTDEPANASHTYNISNKDNNYILTFSVPSGETAWLYNSNTKETTSYKSFARITLESLDNIFLSFTGKNKISDIIDLSSSKKLAKSVRSKNTLVVDGRVWKTIERGLPDKTKYPEGTRSWEQTFKGTKQIGDKLYNVLYAKTTAPIESVEYEVAYMREEEGKVYSIMNPELPINIAYDIYMNSFAYSSEEALVYDFNAEEGTTYYWFGSKEKNQEVFNEMRENQALVLQANYLAELLTGPIKIDQILEENQFGVNLKVFNYRLDKGCSAYVELVGDVCGKLPFPGIINAIESQDIYELNVYEADGTKIYSSKEVARLKDVNTASISLISQRLIINDADSKSTVEIYDVSGNKILHVYGTACKEIRLDNIPQGIYIARIFVNDNYKIYKFHL